MYYIILSQQASVVSTCTTQQDPQILQVAEQNCFPDYFPVKNVITKCSPAMQKLDPTLIYV